MKTEYSQEDVRQFLQTTEHAKTDTIEQLAEGYISQAFGFESLAGNKYVLRIANRQNDFLADKYAGDTFGQRLLAPRITAIGNFGDGSYYCVSERAEGVPSDQLSEEALQTALPDIYQVFARIAQTDISATQGYGGIDIQTGNALGSSWKSCPAGYIGGIGVESLKISAKSIGLDLALIDEFMDQFNNNLPYASEVRRLFHGDLGVGNTLLYNGKVTAIIDWAQMGYGDWMRDFARLEFWRPGTYGDAEAFANQYGLEADHIAERMALYQAVNALATIDFSYRHKNESTAQWLRDNVADKRM